MKSGMIRQGDVLLVPVAVQPPAGTAITQEVVLAQGELTGHAHRLRAEAVLEWAKAGQRYVQVVGDRPGTITHEEHDPIPAPVIAPLITYQIIPQVEWDLRGQWRKVKD